jgi:hypothetical protein
MSEDTMLLPEKSEDHELHDATSEGFGGSAGSTQTTVDGNVSFVGKPLVIADVARGQAQVQALAVVENGLSARTLCAAENGAKFLIIVMNNLCRYARGEAPPHSIPPEYYLDTSYSASFVRNTIGTFRELMGTKSRPRVNHWEYVRNAFNALSPSVLQQIAIAVAGKLPPIQHRNARAYPTAFSAAFEMASDLTDFYVSCQIADWSEERESDA